MKLVAQLRPDVKDPATVIASGLVWVDGRVVINPASQVPLSASVVVREPKIPRGKLKLDAALREFGVSVRGRVALDVGAGAGGFTLALLEAGAQRVYSVDAGHGQLSGSLRQDLRVVNLEATNLGSLGKHLVPERVEVVTMDLSYLSLAMGVPQLERVSIDKNADLVALVKPMFELGLDRPPTKEASLEEAVHAAALGIEKTSWEVIGRIKSPIGGAHGATEFFIHARRIVS